MPPPGAPADAPERGSAEPPLDRPWYGATFRGSVRRFWRKYATFSGRASRSEYWWWQLVAAMVGVLINLVYQPFYLAWFFRFEQQVMRSPDSFPTSPFALYGQLLGSPGIVVVLVIVLVWWAATIVPTLALGARRLHDAGFRAWWLLLYLVPGAYIVLFVMAILEPRPEGARFDA